MSENDDSTRSERARERATGRPKSADVTASNEPFTRSEWERLHTDPDLRDDLGYSLAGWETIETATDASQVIFMPKDEELLRDDTFIVADERTLCDLGKHY